MPYPCRGTLARLEAGTSTGASGVSALDPDLARRGGLALGAGLWLAAIGWILWWPWPPGGAPGIVEVVHWANGHIAGDDALLPAFAARFNTTAHRTSEGHVIVVK